MEEFILVGHNDSHFDEDNENGVLYLGYHIILDKKLSHGDHTINSFQ